MSSLTHLEMSRKGGESRARKLSEARRSEIAARAANARWAGHVRKHKQRKRKPKVSPSLQNS